MNTNFTSPLNTNIIGGVYIAPPAPYIPALFHSSDLLLTASGSSVTLRSTAAGENLFSADLGDTPLCAERSGNTLYIMTPSGCHRIIATSAGYSHIPPFATLPPVNFSLKTQAQLQYLTSAVESASGSSLTNGINPASTLFKRISAELAHTYSRLSSAISSAAMFFQPVLARCRFVDSAGATLMLSHPQLLGVGEGWQCLGGLSTSVTKYSDTHFVINEFTLSATPWQPKLIIPAASHPSMKGVAAVKVELSQPIDFFDPDSTLALRIERPRDNAPVCTAFIPGSDYGSKASLHSRVKTILASRSSFTEVASWRPEASWREVTIPPAPALPASCGAASLSTTSSIPLSFAARHVVRSGDTIAWANLTLLPFTPPHPAQILAPGNDTFTCTVRFLTHSGLLCSSTAEVDSASRSFAAMIACPDPQVCAVEVTFADTAATISATMRPFGSVAVSFPATDGPANASLPHSPLPPVSRPGSILSALATDPLVPVSQVNSCAGAITGLAPACRSQSSWDFSRTHLIAASTAGIHAVCFNSRAGYVSATLIDPRPAPSGALFAPDAVYIPVAGGIVLVTGARARKFIRLPFDVGQMHYCTDEQMVVGRSSSGSSLWIAPTGELSLIGDEGRVSFSAEIAVPSSSRPLFLSVPVLTSSFAGSLTMFGHSGNHLAPSACYGCASINGAIPAPLRMRVASLPPRLRVIVCLSGSTAPDFSISTPRIS